VRRISVPSSIDMVNVLGPRDEFLRILERDLAADIHVRGNEVTLTGTHTAVSLAADVVGEMVTVLRTGQGLTPDAVERICSMMTAAEEASPADVLTHNILSSRGKTIRPKTLNQKRYVDAIDKHTVVFGIGPAGTGKTYLAVAKAVQALQNKEVNRIILTRPAVEAGERLGFLPGTLNEKIDPYLRPLYDALHDMLDPDSIPRLLTAGTIEVAPLAYMRGRAQPVDTPVLTPDGFRPIGELAVGDLVVGSDGRSTPVLGVYPQGTKDIYRVSAQDGASTLVCGEHLWFVTTRSDRRRGKAGRVAQTTDMIGNLRTAHAHRYELPIVGPVQMPEREVPLDPYSLGLLLGDGSLTTSTTPSFATRDAQPAEASRGGLLIADPVTTISRQLGLADAGPDTTFVPGIYLRNSESVRLAVLQGLLDANGEPVPQRDRTCRVRYATCTDRLRDDVIFLVRSLGGVAHIETRHHAHVIDIRLPAGMSPFRLKRKMDLYDERGGGRPMRFVHAIEPAGRAECVCIAVAAPDSLYVTEDFLVTHNTLNDAFIILDEAQNTSMEQMKMFLTRLGFGSRIVVTGDITQVDLPGGTRSGLRVVQGILDNVDDIAFCHLTNHDVVRHKLVGRIVAAYDRFEATDAPVPPRNR
jgi:phosphate starvation-inducible PhoH-like protein